MTDLRSDSDAPGPAAHAPLEQCAPYLWGDLDPQDEWDFERHLGTCAICLDECDRLGPLVGAFSGLRTGEIADLVTDDPILTPAEPPRPAPTQAGSAPTPAELPGSAPTPAPRGGCGPGTATASVGPAATAPASVESDDAVTAAGAGVAPGHTAPSPPGPAQTRPGPADRPPTRDTAGRGPAGREPDRARRGRRRWLVAGTLAMVAAVSLGVTLGQRQQGNAPDARQSTVNPVNAGVTVEGVGASARLSVTVSARTDRPGPVAKVRATVVGLTPGVEYRLYAVAADTRTYQVAQWTATAGPQEVTGDIAVAVDTLAFFAVAQADGTAVVSARIGRPASPR
ncbi:hypothetical protein AB0K20_15755 [Micromonospora matsumotoense]|uniref:hypothetical protein n=1 Tax=Micromonospora matsumotoense TaxID=121616 RepID=UPI00344A60C5